MSTSSDEFTHPIVSLKPSPFNQADLNDLIRDLSLSKESSELLASRLEERNLLQAGTNITFYRNREKEFLQFFTSSAALVYCHNIQGLLLAMGLLKYEPEEWRIFIDSSKRSLKCVLLHNGNRHGSIPIGHSVRPKEGYKNFKLVLGLMKYSEHNWIICLDTKMINFLLGQQSGYTKYPYFLCFWDSRDKAQHWTKQEWPSRNSLVVGEKNVINKPLVDAAKVLFPPLHIKLGLIKQCVKVLKRDGDCFRHIFSTFPDLSDEKLKAGIFDDPQIRKPLKDSEFVHTVGDKSLLSLDV